MPEPVCPHCGKVTEGELHDKDIYVLVVCAECQTILGVLPKYYQKCTWKRQPEDYVEAEGEDIEVGVPAAKPRERAGERGKARDRPKDKPTWD